MTITLWYIIVIYISYTHSLSRFEMVALYELAVFQLHTSAIVCDKRCRLFANNDKQ